MRRALLLAAVILTALLLQTTVFADIRLLGARPELMYLLTIAFGLLEDAAHRGDRVALVAFKGGLPEATVEAAHGPQLAEQPHLADGDRAGHQRPVPER